MIRAGVLAGVAHGFLGRRGGVSTGLAAGLNARLGGLDDPGAVARNRAIAAEAVLPGARLVTVRQVHSPDCLVAGDWDEDARPEADALVSDRRSVLLGVQTADCAPVLLADREAGVVGAAHAGWKGALGGVCQATVAAMVALGAERERIVAAIGPCIAQPSYEVDDALRERVLMAEQGHQAFFAPGRAGHWQFDLAGFVAGRLAAAGVRRVEALGLDTYGAPERFFSYRRTTHRGEADYGCQIALIGNH